MLDKADTGMDRDIHKEARMLAPWAAELVERAVEAAELEAKDMGMDMAKDRMDHATTYASIPSSTTRLTTTSKAR